MHGRDVTAHLHDLRVRVAFESRAPPAKLHGPQAPRRFEGSCARSGRTDSGTMWSTVVLMPVHLGPRMVQYGSRLRICSRSRRHGRPCRP
jgi:hypothetical protein